ncbi:MAG: DUF6364 family protein [Spirochaetaceae bacterium]|jgi:hypothetical protein|nr:DUF6364 family protein [Spirochaetaceae bacterium]
MSKKLTLNIDDDLITFAHDYSKQNGVSVSKLVEQYLIQLKTVNTDQKLNPKILGLYGIFEDSPLPDKKILREQFYEKDSH